MRGGKAGRGGKKRGVVVLGGRREQGQGGWINEGRAVSGLCNCVCMGQACKW